MEFYPFFLHCIEHYSDDKWKRKELELLAFGKGALIIHRKDGSDVLLAPGGEFVIPTEYSDKQRVLLEEKLWGYEKDSEFFNMQRQIEQARSVWSTAKKKDRLRMLDRYIIEFSSSEVLVRNMLVYALILKILQVKESANYAIISLEEKYDTKFYNELACPPYNPPTNSKTLLSSIWSKKTKTPSTLAGLAISLRIE